MSDRRRSDERAGSTTPRAGRVAVLVADGVDGTGAGGVLDRLRGRGAVPDVLAPTDGPVRTADGDELAADRAIGSVTSRLYDAVLVPCGPDSTKALAADDRATTMVAETYTDKKAVAAFGSGREVLRRAGLGDVAMAGEDDAAVVDGTVVTSSKARDDVPDEFVDELAAAVARYRTKDRVSEQPPD